MAPNGMKNSVAVRKAVNSMPTARQAADGLNKAVKLMRGETEMTEAERVKEFMARNKQVGGNHYKTHDIQPWDIIDSYGLDFYEGNALKYLLREKGSRVEDLQKAIHYLEKKVEMEQRHG